jgi:uncharacterized protein (UPF0332 family)
VETAKKNVDSYLKEGLLRKVEKQENILEIYQKNSQESLEVANILYRQNVSSLWVIVTAYNAMYYAANAVLYSLGYKVGNQISHKVTSDALITFVRNKLEKSLIEHYEQAQLEALNLSGQEADAIIQSFDRERIKRSRFQYETTEQIKRSKAKTSLERAKKFIFEMEKMVT